MPSVALPDRSDRGSAPRLIAADVSTARASVFVSIGALAASLLGGLLAVSISIIVGAGPRTDGFLAAYSAYLIFLLFGSSMRVAMIPLFGSTDDGDGFSRAAADSVGRLVPVFAMITAALVVFSPLLGRVLVPGADAQTQSTATLSIAILGAAAFCQSWSAALSAVLTGARRFVSSSALYVFGSAASLSAAVALMYALGIAGAAIGVLVGSLGLLATHLKYLARLQFSARPLFRDIRSRITWGMAARVSAGASVPMILQLDLTISLATIAGTTGAVTGYVYGYLVTILATGLTAATIGLVTMPNLIAAANERLENAAGNYLATTSAYSIFLFAPIAAGFAVFGRPLIDALFSGSLDTVTLNLCWNAGRVFLLMGVAWTLLQPAITIALTHHLYRRLAISAIAIVPIHTTLVIVAATHSPLAVGVAHAATGSLLVLVILVVVFGRDSWRAARRMLAASIPVAPLALVFPLTRQILPDHLTVLTACGGLIAAATIYLVAGAVLWRSVGGRMVRLLIRGA